ncbi:MAG: DUF2802 domain-containing protein [Pseudomonadota bacterium]
MINVSLPLYLLILANAAIVVAATFAVLRVEKALSASNGFWSSPSGAAVRAGYADVDERDRLMREIQALQRSVEVLRNGTEPRDVGRVVDMSFGRAVRMAKGGASIDELSETCGLSLGEAQLLHRLHGGAATGARVSGAGS